MSYIILLPVQFVSIRVEDCSSFVYKSWNATLWKCTMWLLLLHDVIRSILAAHANSGKTDSGTQSRALHSYLTSKSILLDVNQVLIAQICMESVIFGSAPFYHVALVLIIALCKRHFLDCLHWWVLTSHHQIWVMRQFNNCKGSKVLISATTELRMIQAWGLHFATKNCMTKCCGYQNRIARMARANTFPEFAIDC